MFSTMIRWKALRYRLEEACCRLLAAAIPRLSRRGCVRLAYGLGALAFAVDRRGRAVALANLKFVFGDQYSEARRRQIAKASYQNFARTMLDLFWAVRLDEQNYAEWIRMEGLAAVREQMARDKRGAVFSCSHFETGNGRTSAAPTLGNKGDDRGGKFQNPRLTALQKIEGAWGATLIPQENSLLRMLKLARRQGITSLMVDLNLPPTQASVAIETFRDGNGKGEGLMMCVSVLHAVLAQRAGALLAPVETQPQADGGCRVIVHPPIKVGADDSLAGAGPEVLGCIGAVYSGASGALSLVVQAFPLSAKTRDARIPFLCESQRQIRKGA